MSVNEWENEPTVKEISDSSGGDDIAIRLTEEAVVIVEYVRAK